MALSDWMPTLKTNLAGIDGIGQVHSYDELPASIIVPLTMLVLPRSGSGTYGAGGPNITHHRVDLVLYHPGQILGEAYASLVPFITLVRDKIYSDVTLGGLVQHCLMVESPEPWYDGPGQLNYGESNLIGIIFRLSIKERESVTVTA